MKGNPHFSGTPGWYIVQLLRKKKKKKRKSESRRSSPAADGATPKAAAHICLVCSDSMMRSIRHLNVKSVFDCTGAQHIFSSMQTETYADGMKTEHSKEIMKS